MDLHELGIQQAHELLSSREVSAEEFTRAYLKRIQGLDPKVKSYVTISEAIALDQARDADQRIKTGNGLSPLTGIPYSAKDSLSTRGIPTNWCAGRMPQRGGAKRGRVKHDSSPLPPNLPVATQLRRFTTKLDELALGYKRKTDGVKVDGIVDVANRISARMDEARDRSEGIPKAETRTERHLRQKYTRSGR